MTNAMDALTVVGIILASLLALALLLWLPMLALWRALPGGRRKRR
jgi:hypothetical protein